MRDRSNVSEKDAANQANRVGVAQLASGGGDAVDFASIKVRKSAVLDACIGVSAHRR
jgi:hypothetical protein